MVSVIKTVGIRFASARIELFMSHETIRLAVFIQSGRPLLEIAVLHSRSAQTFKVDRVDEPLLIIFGK